MKGRIMSAIRKVGRAVVAGGFAAVLALSLPARIALAEEATPYGQIMPMVASFDDLHTEIKAVRTIVTGLANVVGTLPTKVWTDVKINRSSGQVSVVQDLADTGTFVRSTAGVVTQIKSVADGLATTVGGLSSELNTVRTGVSQIWDAPRISRNGQLYSPLEDLGITGDNVRSVSSKVDTVSSRVNSARSDIATVRSELGTLASQSSTFRTAVQAKLNGMDDMLDIIYMAASSSGGGGSGMTPAQASAMVDSLEIIANGTRSTAADCKDDWQGGVPWWVYHASFDNSPDPCDMVARTAKQAEQARRDFNQAQEQARRTYEQAQEQARRTYEKAEANAREQAREAAEQARETARRLYQEAQDTARENREKAEREAIAQGFREQIEGLKEAVDGVAEKVEGIGDQIAESVDGVGEKLSELFEEYFGEGSGGSDGGTTDPGGYGDGITNVGGLESWGNAAQCVYSPGTGNMCNGPTLDLGFMVWEIFPCDLRPQMEPALSTWRSIVAAMIIAGAGALAARWIFAAFALNGPKAG